MSSVNHAQEVRRLCAVVIDAGRTLQRTKSTPCSKIETVLRSMKSALTTAMQHRRQAGELDSCTSNDVITATSVYNALAQLFQASCLDGDDDDDGPQS